MTLTHLLCMYAGAVIGMLGMALFKVGPSTTEEELMLANHRLACDLADAQEQLARRS